MMLFSTKATKARTLRKQQMEENALSDRKVIENKLKDAKAVDQQLAQVLSDTKELTTSIQQKLSTRLKITKNTIKTIVRNVNEGIVILNSEGIVIESNSAFESTFTCGQCILGSDFKQICNVLNPLKEDGERFILTPNFKSLSQDVFDSKNFSTEIQPEIMLEVHPCSVESFKCTFSLAALDNAPEHVDDVSFILFFRCLKRSADRDRRLEVRV